jgi:imidazolonepropionase-like amidohydrolase
MLFVKVCLVRQTETTSHIKSMKRLILFCTILTFTLLSPANARRPVAADVVAITGATIVDGTGAPPLTGSVLIRGDRIAAVGEAIDIPAGAAVINAAGMTLMPGIFDLHTHLPYASGGRVDGDWPKNLKAYLYCGVTSVVDFGTYPETFEPMRRLVATGVIPGPRLHLAARISTPGGHGAEGGRGDFFSQEVTTPREARAAVRRVLPYRPDVIKAFTDGWRYGAAPDMTSMREDTLTALVDEAHKNGLEVLTHTVTLDKAKIAARAGVDVIDHGIGDKEADDELLKLMKEKGTTYAPTLAVYEPRGRDILTPLLATVLDPAARNGINPPLVAPGDAPLKPAAGSAENGDPPRLRRWQTLQHNTAALRAAGIRFGTGTDAGVTGTHHGWATLRELELLVQGGLTPLEAITAATGNSAKALHVDNERGTIAAGRLADLVLIAGEPHKQIGDLEKISRVFLGGKELDRDKLARELAMSEITPLPAIKATAKVDDFEGSSNGFGLRSALETLWVYSSDAGVDASKVLFTRILRAGSRSDHAVSLIARMSEKDRPFARLNVPLSRGAVEPVDAREFKGIQFDARGDGEYRLIVPTRGLRDGNHFQAQFTAGSDWRTISIDFASLTQQPGGTAAWTGSDLLMLSFEVARKAGESGWLELDNIRFYR